jgi:mannosyltransferase
MNIKKYWALILVIFVGLLLRFYHNLDVSLWHDEAFSALLIKYPWQEMMYRISLDVHPPMYYIFLRFWNYAFGDSLLALRGFSIFFSTACIWAAWAFVKEAFSKQVGADTVRPFKDPAIWAAILIAINPFQLQFVTEARMYTFGAFFALLAAYFLVKALNLQKNLHQDEQLNMPNLPQDLNLKRKMIWNYTGFTVSMVIIIYTHYYLFFTAAALGLYGLIFLYFHHKWNIKKYFYLLTSYFLILVSFLPWLKTFLFQYKQVGQGYWIPPMNIWSIPSTFWDMLLSFSRDTNKTSTQFWLSIVTIFSIYMFIRFLRKTDGFHKWLVTLCVVAPFAGSVLFLLLARVKGSSSSVYLDRYFLFAGVFYSIALALFLHEMNIKWLKNSIFVIYILTNLMAFNNYWAKLDVAAKPGMSAASRMLKANVEPGHKIYVGSSFIFFNLKYYLNQEKIANAPLLYSGGNKEVKNLPHFAGTAILTDQDLLPNFSEGVKNGDTVWLVFTDGFGSNKPETPKNWTQVKDYAFPEVRPYPGTSIFVTEYKVN